MLYGDEKREYQRNWIKNKRENLIKMMGGKCVKCDSIENLQFHHKNQYEKEFNINHILSYKQSFIVKELEKCELLCEKCHKEMHVKRLVCGTSTAYGYGCRCSECKQANTDRRAEYRARTGKR